MMRGVYLLPNLFTTGNLFFGFYSVVASLKGRYELAAWGIVIAIFFDIMDGKVARLMGATSNFGTQYDSLADLVSFGVAPGIMAYNWILSPLGRLGWLISFLFLTCGALRLARFNLQASARVGKENFQGLPIPAAAGTVATSYLFLKGLNFPLSLRSMPAFYSILMISLSFLMVSNVEYKALKESNKPKRHPFGTLFLAVVLLFILAAEPHIAFFLFTISYVLSGPLMNLRKRRLTLARHKEIEV